MKVCTYSELRTLVTTEWCSKDIAQVVIDTNHDYVGVYAEKKSVVQKLIPKKLKIKSVCDVWVRVKSCNIKASSKVRGKKNLQRSVLEQSITTPITSKSLLTFEVIWST